MSTEIPHSRNQRLREVAILVASLDEQMAKHLVASMPSEDAAAVREAVEHLGIVDPDEQSEIVAKFQQSTKVQSPTKYDGVELDASLLARIEEHERGDDDPQSAAAKGPLETLSDTELNTVVSMLSAEHPQTIAIVLSRLNPSSAADLLSKFPPPVQADVLVRMANCGLADDLTVQVIESQLGQWLEQHRQQRRRMAAGLDAVQRILASTPETKRKTVLTQMKGRDPELVGRLAKNQNRVSDSYDSTSRSDADGKKPAIRERPHPAKESRQYVRVAPPPVERRAIPSSKMISARPAEELDQLDDSTLIAALNRTDRQAVTLALAGASETLMKRVLRGLPRRHASKLRRQLRDIGPTRLSDMLAAQQHLLQSAHLIQSQQ